MATLPCAGPYNGPDVVIHPESEPFWYSLGQGEFKLQRCDNCQTIRFPIGPVCYNCGAMEHEWVEVATDGRVSAAITVERATGNQIWAAEVPFIVAQVDLSAVPRLPGRVLCDCGRGTEHGEPVTGAYLSTTKGYGVLCFVHGCRQA